MRMKMWWLWLVASLLCAANSTPAWAQRMKLLAPGVGWTISGRSFGRQPRLLWTTNGGVDWKDITPPHPNDAVMGGRFFLDTNHGWVTFVRDEPGVSGRLQFDLATTGNAGANWSYEPVQLPTSQAVFSGGAGVTFADQAHGWIGLATNLSTAALGAGALFATSDSGRSWQRASGPIGAMTMLSAEFGWLVSGPADDQLYVTRDGAKTWQQIRLRSPIATEKMNEYDQQAQIWKHGFQAALSPDQAQLASKWMSHQLPPTYAAYDVPVFKDSKHGYISVTYPGVVVLFVTSDGGITWKPDRMMTGVKSGQMGRKLPSAVADSTWIIGRAPQGSQPQLKMLGPSANVTDNTMPPPEESGISEMSFVSAKEGWVRTVNGKLLSTTDGGARWTDITPGRAPHAPSS
jgi:photosystem II stability/assembly factor-like uncharacterized protein